MPKKNEKQASTPINPLTDGRLGWWDVGIWVLGLIGAAAVTMGVTGVVTQPTLPALGAVAPWLVVAVPTLIAVFAPMLLYGITTAVINWIGRVKRPKLWSALRASRVGMALMPLLWVIGLATLPWTWPVILAATLIVPVVFALFQRFPLQYVLDRWATSKNISEKSRRRALWLGANLQAKNADGQSVLDCAVRSGHVGIVENFANLDDPFSVFNFQHALEQLNDAPDLGANDRLQMAKAFVGTAERVGLDRAATLQQIIGADIEKYKNMEVLNVYLNALKNADNGGWKVKLQGCLKQAVEKSNIVALQALLSQDLGWFDQGARGECEAALTAVIETAGLDENTRNAMAAALGAAAQRVELEDCPKLFQNAIEAEIRQVREETGLLKTLVAKLKEADHDGWPKKLGECLCVAANLGTKAAVTALLNENPGLFVEPGENIPMEIARERGDEGIIAALVAAYKKAVLEDGSDDVVVALAKAAAEGGEDKVNQLLRLFPGSLIDHRGCPAFDAAAEHGQVAMVNKLLPLVVNENPRLIYVAFGKAAAKGELEVVERLVAYMKEADGLDVGTAMSTRLSRQGAPLALAAAGGHQAVVEVLYPLIGAADQANAAMAAAAKQGHEGIVKWLHGQGVSAHAGLGKAAEAGKVQIVQYLFSKAVKEEQQERAAKLKAAQDADWSRVRSLIGSPPPKACMPDESPLQASYAVFDAVEGGQLEVLNWLCTMQQVLPINMNQPDLQGQTLLHRAAASKDKRALEIMQWLLQQGGIKVNERTKRGGETVLHRVTYTGSDNMAAMVDLLLEHEADKTIVDADGRFAWEYLDLTLHEDVYMKLRVPKTLAQAVQWGDLAAVEKKAAMAARDGFQDWTYKNDRGYWDSLLKLPLTAIPRQLDIAEALLQANPEIADRADMEYIPYLLWAAGRYDVELVTLLVRYVNVNLVSASSLTALMYALRGTPKKDGQMLEVVQLLVDKHADVNVKYPSDERYPRPHQGGRSLLHIAASNPHVEIPVLDYLLEKGLALYATNDAGMNVLQCAVRAGCRPDVIQWLVDKGEPIDQQVEGGTLLDLALQGFYSRKEGGVYTESSKAELRGYQQTLECLLAKGVGWDKGQAFNYLHGANEYLPGDLIRQLNTGEVTAGAASAGQNMHAKKRDGDGDPGLGPGVSRVD